MALKLVNVFQELIKYKKKNSKMFRIPVSVRTKFTVKNTLQLFDINAHTGAISGNHTLMNCKKVESDNIWTYIAKSIQKTKCFENPLTFVKVASQSPLPIQFSWAKYAMGTSRYFPWMSIYFQKIFLPGMSQLVMI